MLETLTKGFRSVKHRFQGKRELTAENIDEALREIRISLLEADVDFKVVRGFVARVKQKALGEVVQVVAHKRGEKIRVTPGDHFVKICQDELEALMGPVDTALRYAPTITKIMMVGLQGSGKTTTSGKLAKFLMDQGRRPMLVAADIYRPAAIQQLRILGERLDVPVYFEADLTPPEICANALKHAQQRGRDVVIFDTAGRLSIDEALMEELDAIKARTQPDNILLVVDAMIGQDAVRTAKAFDERMALDGFIMTKLDGDARGGSALSIKAVTGKPIKFLGVGEDLEGLEVFRPEGLASRIMGFGDIVGLMSDFEKVVDEEQAEADAKKLLSGRFDMWDFLEQIRTIRKMGPLKEIFEKMPFFSDGLPDGAQVDEKALGRIEAIIQSMTKAERQDPTLIEKQKGRAKRISRGCGQPEEEIVGLVGRFKAMQTIMGAIGAPGGGNLLYKIPGFKQFAQMQQMKGMDMGEIFGQMGVSAPGMGGMGMPGMGMPGMGGAPTQRQIQEMLPGLPKGYLPPGTPGGARQTNDKVKKDKEKARKRQKAAQATRRKQRKKR
ncbi:signal recognition particle protein [Myxococcota bacterium]|nr:signal recognition particle protein [Myxococcota bacterium]MBU1430992.1 signal recognition particle protein [Myxococcota bacterium]MBU1896395.1 signal recognition particle protein [Myxococcota bacterium]